MARLRRTALAAGPALLAAAVWLSAHEGHVALPSRGAQVDAEKGYILLSRESRDALDVRSAEIDTTPLPETVLAYVTLVAPWAKHAYVSPRLPGRITRVAVRPGQSVTRGEVIAELASVELDNLQREVARLQTEINLARKVVAGLKASGGAVALSAVIDAENAALQLESAVTVNRAKWLGLGLDGSLFEQVVQSGKPALAAFPVTSPIDGAVLHIDLTPGKVVDVGEHVAEVIDTTAVHARLGVLEADMARVTPGLEATIRLTALPGEAFRATVAGVDSALDPVTNQNAVWAVLENPAGAAKFLPGMSGQAVIALPGPAEARVIPAAALIDDGLAQYVLVEEAKADQQSEYRRRNVVVIRRQGDRIEIRSPDLFPGDRVVVQGAHELGGFFVPGVLKLGPEAAQTLGLQTAQAAEHAVDDVLTADGRVELRPESRVAVSSPLGGTITRLLVDRNAAVAAGQVVAEVFSLEFQTLQLDLIRDQLGLDLAEAQLKNLTAGGEAVARRKLLEAEGAKLTLANRVESLKLRLEIAGLTGEQVARVVKAKTPFDALPVRAVSAGTVVRFDKILGQGIKAEEPIFEVHDGRGARVEAFLAERDVSRVRPGFKARVRLVGRPDLVLAGTVAPGGRLVTADDQALSAWVDLDAAGPLKRGELARIDIVLTSAAPRLAVPRTAVLEESVRRFVFVRKADGEWERRPVVTGGADDRFVEIRSGLQAGETVATHGVAGLQTAYAAIR